jgi:hypothetical protein
LQKAIPIRVAFIFPKGFCKLTPSPEEPMKVEVIKTKSGDLSAWTLEKMKFKQLRIFWMCW